MSGAIPIDGLHHYALTVSDLERSIAWYGRILGLEPGARWSIADGAVRIALVESPALRIELFETDTPRADGNAGADVGASLSRLGPNHVAVAVDDLDATVAALEAEGVVIALPRTRSEAGFDYVFALDPDGNRIEFVRPAARPAGARPAVLPKTD